MYSKSEISLRGRGLGMTVLTVSWVFILTSVFMCMQQMNKHVRYSQLRRIVTYVRSFDRLRGR
jgi:hypothetical protein